MFMACGVAAYSAGVFHLMTHAFFKGLLFSWFRIGHPRPQRRTGHAPNGWPGAKKIPWTFWTMLCGTIAIAGIPPFAGFMSKGRNPLARLFARPEQDHLGAWPDHGFHHFRFICSASCS